MHVAKGWSHVSPCLFTFQFQGLGSLKAHLLWQRFAFDALASAQVVHHAIQVPWGWSTKRKHKRRILQWVCSGQLTFVLAVQLIPLCLSCIEYSIY